MTPQEQELVNELFDRLTKLETKAVPGLFESVGFPAGSG